MADETALSTHGTPTQDKTKKISVEEAKKGLYESGYNLSDDEVEHIWHIIDVSRSGTKGGQNGVPMNRKGKEICIYNISVSSWSSHGGGLYHGLRRTKVGAWMPRTVGEVLRIRAWVTSPKAC